jgi:hypothetical protein
MNPYKDLDEIIQYWRSKRPDIEYFSIDRDWDIRLFRYKNCGIFIEYPDSNGKCYVKITNRNTHKQVELPAEKYTLFDVLDKAIDLIDVGF